MELYKEILAQVLSRQNIHVSFDNLRRVLFGTRLFFRCAGVAAPYVHIFTRFTTMPPATPMQIPAIVPLMQRGAR